MSVRFSGLQVRRRLTVYGVLLARVSCVLAQEPVSGSLPATRHESSPTNATAVVTASSRSSSVRVPVNRLLLLEERITRALTGLSSGNNLEPVAPRPVAPVVRHLPQSKPDQEADALRKDEWMLMTPESFAEHEASLELRKLMRDGGMLKERFTPEEQLFRDMGQSGIGMGTKGMVDSLNSRDLDPTRFPSDKDGKTPAPVARSEENLRNMLATEGKISSIREQGTLDLFRAAEPMNSDRRKESYVDSYRQFMATAPVASDFASSQLGRIATDPLQPSQPLQSGLMESGRGANLMGSQFGSINPVLTPRQPLGATEQAVNQWNKFYTPPTVEPPRSPAPPKPSFEAPRRRF